MPKCKDCIHSEICASHLKAVRGIYGAVMSISGREVNHFESALSEISITIEQICCGDCEHFKDRSRFVELPCKLGDTVYYFNSAGEIFSQKVSGFIVNFVGILVDSDVMFDSHLMGDRFFSTREEAEQTLKERENNAN